MLGYDDDDDDDDDDKWNVMIEEKDGVNEVENEWAITAIGHWSIVLKAINHTKPRLSRAITS